MASPTIWCPTETQFFLAPFWRELFCLSGTKLRYSTTYHPESNGQTKVLNRTLEQYLRSFVHDRPALWYSFLPLAEWSYNTQYLSGSSPIEAVDSMMATRQALHTKLQHHLLKSHNAMKAYADRHRHDVHFQVEDLVYVRLRPYRQFSVRPHYSKLAKRFYRPFRVTKKIGPVAYRLQLPTRSKIHPVFHVSLLKPHNSPPPTTDETLPLAQVDHHPIIEPLSFLDWKWNSAANPPSQMVLVQWRRLAPEETSWED